jgi:SAM-dependent methyltransferase
VTAGEAYEAFLVPAVFRPWAEMVLSLSPPAAGSEVLDVACGTGIGARLASRVVGPPGRVVGLDPDEGMLAVARGTARGPGAAPIEWRRGSAEALGLDDAAFDYVLCLEGLQFFPDRGAGLRQMRRVLRRGGRLVASVWGPLEANPAYHALSDGLRAFVSDAAAHLPPFTLGDPDAVRDAVASAGFARVTVGVETLMLSLPPARTFVEWIAAGGPTTRRNLAQLPGERRADFDRFVAERLAPYRAPAGLSMPSRRTVVVAM